jgi:hypothetical protein
MIRIKFPVLDLWKLALEPVALIWHLRNTLGHERKGGWNGRNTV